MLSLLGPNFSLIADEYGKLRDMITRDDKYKRIFVYFGGADLLTDKFND